MLLNENYFDDIEITDDDIKTQDIASPESSVTGTYANPQEWFNDMKSKYFHIMVIILQKNEIMSQTEIWETKLPSMFKRLKYIFDAYGVEYSEPVIQDTWQDYILRKYRHCKYFDWYGYKLISEYDTLSEFSMLYSDVGISNLCVVLYFNKPDNYTYTRVCKFIRDIKNYFWKDGLYRNIIINNTMNFNSKKIKYGLNLKNPAFYSINNSPSGRISQMFAIIRQFFPEKDEDALLQELQNNYDLVEKISKYV